jgi:hypothetical protein
MADHGDITRTSPDALRVKTSGFALLGTFDVLIVDITPWRKLEFEKSKNQNLETSIRLEMNLFILNICLLSPDPIRHSTTRHLVAFDLSICEGDKTTAQDSFPVLASGVDAGGPSDFDHAL